MQSRAVRIVSVVGGAAILGALIGSACLFAFLLTRQSPYRADIRGFPLLIAISLPFTLIGSTLLAAIYKGLVRVVRPSHMNTIIVIAGLITGILFLEVFFLFLQSQGVQSFYEVTVALIGAGFGTATALFWTILHKATLSPR